MKVLYLGLTPPISTREREIIHYPVITIIPLPPHTPQITETLTALPTYTHLLFTSKTSVRLLCEALTFHHLSVALLKDKYTVAVGSATALEAESLGISVSTIALQETAEGVVQALKLESLNNAHAFWPHASRARSVLSDFFAQHNVPLTECILYETHLVRPPTVPNLDQIDEIFFSSPSTVDGFLAIFGALPLNKKLTAQGPITEASIAIAKKVDFVPQ